MMKTWRITYPDGTWEDVRGSGLYVYENVLQIITSHDTSYNRTSRTWPIANVRSWEQR